jgi:hypothetical protein
MHQRPCLPGSETIEYSERTASGCPGHLLSRRRSTLRSLSMLPSPTDPAARRRHIRRFATDVLAGDVPSAGALPTVAVLALAEALGGATRRGQVVQAIRVHERPPELVAVHRAAPSVQTVDLAPHLDVADRLIDAADAPDTLAWLFQYLKVDDEREAIGKAHTQGTKIAGRKLLAATQFFTDSYMVDRLVSATLEAIDLDTPGLVVADPACGGGNFLVAALDYFAAHQGPERVAHLLEHVLCGFDLDPRAATVARLSLLIHATRLTGRIPAATPRVLAGKARDERGFLDRRRSPALYEILDAADRRVLLTNPPFLGRRLMSRPLKEWLSEHVPDAGNDLCLAFLLRCLDALQDGDLIGLVHQSNWFHLGSFEAARRDVLGRTAVLSCDDLGAGAFADLTGEKSRVVLSVLRRGPADGPARFHRLVQVPRAQKIAALANPDPADQYAVSPQRLLDRAGAIWAYHVPAELDRLSARLPRYSASAEPMQGTSTGNNPVFVRYGWRAPADNPDWRPASKGGGYCKWAGLHRYRVLWGPDGEAVRNNPGSAIRNLDRMHEAALVYSDTGTAGMNVRLRRPEELFIASGPGIVVRRGHLLAHLAFLNSRLATYFMRTLSPKLTISAGYIGALPFPDELADDADLIRLAQGCVDHKNADERESVRSELWAPAAPQPVLASLRMRLDRELERLTFEAAIEDRVAEAFELDVASRGAICREVGAPAGSFDGACPPADELRAAVATWVSSGGQMETARRGLPTAEGLLEWLALRSGARPSAIRAGLDDVLDDCPTLLQTSRDDALHRVVLGSLGVGTGWTRAPQTVPLSSITDTVATALDTLHVAADPGSWVREQLGKVHTDAFLKCPFLHVGRAARLEVFE